MKLVNFGAGEICDRISILQLKITTGREKGRDTGHWESERAQLLTKIHAKTLNGAWFDGVLELAAVNALIWHAEDDLRDHRIRDQHPSNDQGVLETIRDLAFRLQSLNDRRAEIVHWINKEAGDGDAKDK